MMMRKALVLVPFLALLGACTTLPQPEEHPTDAMYAWKPLFDKTLSDAEFAPGAWGYDKDGYLTPSKDNPIWSKAEYENYVLDLEYKMEAKGNSGVFIYISNLDQFPKYKIEVQLMDDYSDNHANELPYQFTGSLYGRAPAAAVVSKPAGEWNRMTVYCRGKNVRVVLNGVAVVDADLDDWKDPLVNPDGTEVPEWHRGFPALSTIPTKGRIGFQGRHENTGVVVKYVRVASLGDSAAQDGTPPRRGGGAPAEVERARFAIERQMFL